MQQQQLCFFIATMHFTTFASRLLVPIARQKSSQRFGGLNGHARAHFDPSFRGSSRSPTIRKLASHEFRPSFDFHRASSPSRSDIDLFFLQCQCFSINILQFYRANWSYGGEFFLYLKPGPTKTGSSSEIIVFPSHRKGSTIGLLPFRIEIFFKKFCELEGWSYRRGEEEGRRIVEGTMVFRFGAALETARLKLDNVWRHDCRKLVGEDCTHRLNSRGSRGL